MDGAQAPLSTVTVVRRLRRKAEHAEPVQEVRRNWEGARMNDRTYNVTGRFNEYDHASQEYPAIEPMQIVANDMRDAVARARVMLRDRYPYDDFTFYVVEDQE